MNLQQLEDILLQHNYRMSILKPNAPTKKKESILDSQIAAIIRSETPFTNIPELIQDINDDKVFDIDFFKKGGSLYDYINPKWLNLSKALYRQRSVGLGTPNAASGEGELMFLFLSKHITKPKKGDLKIDDQIYEIKGEGIRVSGNISGNDFRLRTLKIAQEFNLKPNIAYKSRIPAVELEKSMHQKHWQTQLQTLTEQERIQFVSEWLNCISGKNDSTSLFTDGVLQIKELEKTIVKMLWKSMVDSGDFDKFIVLGKGTSPKIFDRDTDKFNRDIDSGTIEIGSDFFRVNQESGKIGWYIS